VDIKKNRQDVVKGIKYPKLNSIYHWIKRNKNICLRKNTNVETERMKALCEENLNTFFDKIEELNNEYKYRSELKVFF
jgi:hypothetical protein